MNIVQIGCNNCKDHVFDFVKEKEDQLKKLVVVDALPKCIESAENQYSLLNLSNLLGKLEKFNYSISTENQYNMIARRI